MFDSERLKFKCQIILIVTLGVIITSANSSNSKIPINNNIKDNQTKRYSHLLALDIYEKQNHNEMSVAIHDIMNQNQYEELIKIQVFICEEEIEKQNYNENETTDKEGIKGNEEGGKERIKGSQERGKEEIIRQMKCPYIVLKDEYEKQVAKITGEHSYNELQEIIKEELFKDRQEAQIINEKGKLKVKLKLPDNALKHYILRKMYYNSKEARNDKTLKAINSQNTKKYLTHAQINQKQTNFNQALQNSIKYPLKSHQNKKISDLEEKQSKGKASSNDIAQSPIWHIYFILLFVFVIKGVQCLEKEEDRINQKLTFQNKLQQESQEIPINSSQNI